MRAAIRKQ